MVSADSDGVVKVWDLRQCKELKSFQCGEHSANGVALDPSGEIGFIASDDASIWIIDLKEGKTDGVLKGHEDQVQDVVVDPFNK